MVKRRYCTGEGLKRVGYAVGNEFHEVIFRCQSI